MKPLDKDNFICISCGFKIRGKDLIEIEKIPRTKNIKEGVVKDKNIFADYPFRCKKCGYNKAEVVERPPYVSDEDSLTFVRCGKCKHTEQLAKKIG